MSLVVISVKLALFNPYLANVPILYPLKTPENFGHKWINAIPTNPDVSKKFC